MLTVKSAATAVGRHPNTIRRWISLELLPASQDQISGAWHIREDELAKFCEENNVLMLHAVV